MAYTWFLFVSSGIVLSHANIINDCGSGCTCNSGESCVVNCGDNVNGEDCNNGITINGGSATDVTIFCDGSATCDQAIIDCGNATVCFLSCGGGGSHNCDQFQSFDCGISACSIWCETGTRCSGVPLPILTDAASFECTGNGCPTSYTSAEFTAFPTPQPTTKEPTTKEPTTITPTTNAPTTIVPTANPITSNPTTNIPTTSIPTTNNPTYPASTISPTSKTPTTITPTTETPTTKPSFLPTSLSVATFTPSLSPLETDISSTLPDQQIYTTVYSVTKQQTTDNDESSINSDSNDSSTIIIIILSAVCLILLLIILSYIVYKKILNNKLKHETDTNGIAKMTKIVSVSINQDGEHHHDNDNDIIGNIDLKNNKFGEQQMDNIKDDIDIDQEGDNKVLIGNTMNNTKCNVEEEDDEDLYKTTVTKGSDVIGLDGNINDVQHVPIVNVNINVTKGNDSDDSFSESSDNNKIYTDYETTKGL